MPRDKKSGHAYAKWRRKVIEASDTCWICGVLLDKAGPYRDPDTGRVNPRYPTADHVVPVAHGGALLDPANGRAACSYCNGSRGAGRAPSALITSEDW